MRRLQSSYRMDLSKLAVWKTTSLCILLYSYLIVSSIDSFSTNYEIIWMSPSQGFSIQAFCLWSVVSSGLSFCSPHRVKYHFSGGIVGKNWDDLNAVCSNVILFWMNLQIFLKDGQNSCSIMCLYSLGQNNMANRKRLRKSYGYLCPPYFSNIYNSVMCCVSQGYEKACGSRRRPICVTSLYSRILEIFLTKLLNAERKALDCLSSPCIDFQILSTLPGIQINNESTVIGFLPVGYGTSPEHWAWDDVTSIYGRTSNLIVQRGIYRFSKFRYFRDVKNRRSFIRHRRWWKSRCIATN